MLESNASRQGSRSILPPRNLRERASSSGFDRGSLSMSVLPWRPRDNQNMVMSSSLPSEATGSPHQGVSQSSTDSSTHEQHRKRLTTARADMPQRSVPYYGSSMSLPEFRKERQRLKFRFPSRDEVTLNSTVDSTGLGLKYNHWIWSHLKNKVYVELFDVDGLPFEHQEAMAVKVTTQTDDNAVKNANDEVRTLSQIDHNHIIAVVGSYKKVVFKEKYQVCVILFPLAQYSLEAYMTDIISQPSEQEDSKFRRHKKNLLTFFACLCNAVGYLHSLPKPIKHRDIKPSNVLIDGRGVVMLADFDTSKMYDSQNDAITSGYAQSTPWFAPDAVQREAKRGFEWDVNSLGFLFLQMATVIFGKTSAELDAKLREKIEEQKRKGAPGGQTTGYARALADGFLHTWIEDLREISRTDPRWLPHRLQKSATAPVDSQYAVVDNFFKTIMDMMEASIKESTRVLRDAWVFFAKLERCADCCTLEQLDRLLLLNPQHPADTSLPAPPNPADLPLPVGQPYPPDLEPLDPHATSDIGINVIVTSPDGATDPPQPLHIGNQTPTPQRAPPDPTTVAVQNYSQATPEIATKGLLPESEVSSVSDFSPNVSPGPPNVSPGPEGRHQGIRLHKTMGKEVIYYDRDRGICDVRPISQIRGIPGELIHLPRVNWHNIDSFAGPIDLWERLGTARKKTWWKRTKGDLTSLFVCGDPPEVPPV